MDSVEALQDEVLLFVDVDGVLNVAIRDVYRQPVALTDANVVSAYSKWDEREGRGDKTAIERVCSTYSRQLEHDEHSTYAKFASDPLSGVSDVLVNRLAVLISLLGKRCKVVLSSSWRHPRHADRVAMLEKLLADHLGKPFEFDARTRMRNDDSTPGGRLEAIAEYIDEYCATLPQVSGSSAQLKVLVLDDFHVHALDWSSGGKLIDSTDSMEEYLETRAPAHVNLSARAIHTYDQWHTIDGLQVEIGAGLSLEHFKRAKSFLTRHTVGSSHNSPRCETAAQAETLPSADTTTRCKWMFGDAGEDLVTTKLAECVGAKHCATRMIQTNRFRWSRRTSVAGCISSFSALVRAGSQRPVILKVSGEIQTFETAQMAMHFLMTWRDAGCQPRGKDTTAPTNFSSCVSTAATSLLAGFEDSCVSDEENHDFQ